MKPPGPRLQPDFGLGIKRDAFYREQLDKSRPFISGLLTDSTLIAATCNTYFHYSMMCPGNSPSYEIAQKWATTATFAL
jgi:hypothetical protein